MATATASDEALEAARWALDQPNSRDYWAGYRARTKDVGTEWQPQRDFTEANAWIVNEYRNRDA